MAVHSPQVVHEVTSGGGLHHIVGHSLTDLHSFQQVGDKQELGKEVLTLRHGGRVAGVGGGKRNEEEASTGGVTTMWILDGEKGENIGYFIAGVKNKTKKHQAKGTAGKFSVEIPLP